MNSLLAFFNFTPMEMLILAGLGVLLFGKRLPEVGRYVGKGIVEFKKGLRGLEDDVDSGSVSRTPEPMLEQPRPPQRVTTTAPKFEDNAGTITSKPPQA